MGEMKEKGETVDVERADKKEEKDKTGKMKKRVRLWMQEEPTRRKKKIGQGR